MQGHTREVPNGWNRYHMSSEPCEVDVGFGGQGRDVNWTQENGRNVCKDQ